MFERFKQRARKVVVLAQEEAECPRHGYIGTEHLLLFLAMLGLTITVSGAPQPAGATVPAFSVYATLCK